MNRTTNAIVLIVLLSALVFISCKKDDDDSSIPIPKQPPILEFFTDQGYTYEDTTVEVDTKLNIGLIAKVNPNSGSDLNSFTIKSIFNGDTTIVVQGNDLPKPEYIWDIPFWSNDNVGVETLFFILTDINGLSTELSFNITTIDAEPFSPTFTASYIVDNLNGVDQLYFSFTCLSNDYEFKKCIVNYPDGLGTEEYLGSGQIFTQNTPFHFSNYFPYIEGEWSLEITSEVYSGAYAGETFVTIIPVVVSP